MGHSVAAVDDVRGPATHNAGGSQLQFGHSVAAVDDVRGGVLEAGRPVWLRFGGSVAAVDDGIRGKSEPALVPGFNSATRRRRG